MTSEISDIFGSITGKLEASIEGVTASIETGDVEFSGGYEDGKISGSIVFNMQRTTVKGEEVTASVKYEYKIEIDLNKIDGFFKKLFGLLLEAATATAVSLVIAAIIGLNIDN